ncbi:MAG: hypothetical protein EOO56_25885, partial [Hymenobacter sp.]
MRFLSLRFATIAGAALLLAGSTLCAAQTSAAAKAKNPASMPNGQAHLLAHEAQIDALLKQ